MTRRRRLVPTPPPGPLGGWTIQRATVTGILFGLCALLLSSALDSWPDLLLYPYVLLLALTALCGASVLWITVHDIRTRGRGGRMRPIRAFDVAAGALLVLPALYALRLIWPEL